MTGPLLSQVPPAIGSRRPSDLLDMAKLYCSEMAGRAADRAVQIFGGRGYMRENVAERLFRELRVERIW
ncbi:acyl-CoA dehydrogenase family protein [Mycolicibacterium psychrotolerans]|uniref:acyl-CoA dehydrogenase family protein n=1 Tax=Mycolicibacterium psychrotolerans TaxID=216929 RepID=UPI00389917A7